MFELVGAHFLLVGQRKINTLAAIIDRLHLAIVSYGFWKTQSPTFEKDPKSLGGLRLTWERGRKICVLFSKLEGPTYKAWSILLGSHPSLIDNYDCIYFMLLSCVHTRVLYVVWILAVFFFACHSWSQWSPK